MKSTNNFDIISYIKAPIILFSRPIIVFFDTHEIKKAVSNAHSPVTNKIS
jgi:hypothetical protein